MEVSTDPTSGQTVDLDFDLGAAATIPATLTIANAGDTVTLGITTTTGGIVLANAINLNPTTTVSTLMLTAAAGISGAGAVSADTITLTANGGAIVSTGNYTANSITLTASTGINTNNGVFNGTNSIGLTANGGNIASNGAFTAGSITFMASTGINTGAGVYSATNSIDLTATTGNINGTGAYTATSAITLTATTGNITSTGLLTAPTVELDGAAIGTGTGGRVNVNASGSLSLTSSGADNAGNIFLASTVLPSLSLGVSTVDSSGQTVDLDFNLGAAATIPATLTIANADDIVRLGITTTTGGIVLANAINLNPVNTLENTDSTLTLTATAGSITGAGILSADSITLSADGIGTAAVPVRLNADDISLTTDGVGTVGNIYVSSASTPTTLSLTTAPPPSAQTVALTFGSETQRIAGDLNLATIVDMLGITAPDSLSLSYFLNGAVTIPSAVTLNQLTLNATGTLMADGNITATGAITATTSVTLMADGTVTGAGAITAPAITIAAASIGTSAARLAVNASQSLSLTSDGAAGSGFIYIGSPVVPTTTLSVSTVAGAHTVDMNFNVPTGSIALPTLALAAADTTTLTLTTTAANANISTAGITNADTVEFTATGNITTAGITGASTVTLNAAGTTTTNGAITASTSITLQSTGALTGTGAFTAPAIDLTAAAIGTSGAPVNVAATTSLTLTSTGVSGGIYTANITNADTVMFTATGNIITTGITGASTVTLNAAGTTTTNGAITASTSITSESAGTLTGTGAFTAPTITLMATEIGAVGARVNAAATTSLTLASTVGGIYLASTALPSTTLMASTPMGSQTVDLDFNLGAAVAIPATFSIAGDTVKLDISTTSTGGINLANAINLNPTSTLTLTLTTTAANANITTANITADTVMFTATGNITTADITGASTVMLDATGNTTANGAITASTSITSESAGTLTTMTGTGSFTAPTITLMATAIGAVGARVNAAATTSLALRSTGVSGGIYLVSTVLPGTSLMASTATGSQTVNLDFNLAAAATIPTTLTIANAGDTVTLDITTTTGGIDLTNHLIDLNLNPATTSTLNLTAAAGISGTRALSADTIMLNATAIGTGTGDRVNLNAPNSLTLMSSGATTAGGIYINASSFPSTSLSVTTVATGNQVPVVDLIFTQATGNIALPSLTLGMGSSVAITATGGNITGGTNVLMADAISLSAVGIGTEASVVRLDPENTLSLTSTGVANAGNIYFSLLSNTATLTLAANPASVQTVSLLQNLSSDLTLSAFPTFTLTGLNNTAGPADLLNIGYIVTGNISISGVITTPDGASISLTATGAITDTGGTASIDATTVTLSAARIGISTNPLTVNATTDLTATATGNTNGDYIYIDGQTMPSTTLTASSAGIGQAVQFSFNTGVGDTSLPTTISFQDNDNTSFTLSADGNISGTVAADTITLDATNGDVAAATDGNIINATLTGGNITLTALSIGTSGTRVAASATDSLSLTTTGSSSNGNIYISGSTVPTTLLSATTHASEQTVDFDYVVASGNIALPTTSTFDIANDIVNFTLSAGTTAASNISGNLDADTISLTTMSGNITASTLNADSITLSADGIGVMGTPITANAATALTVTSDATTLRSGDIYIASTTVPSTTLMASTAVGTVQRVNFAFTEDEAVALPGTFSIFRSADVGEVVGNYDEVTLELTTTTGDITVGTAIDFMAASASTVRLLATGAGATVHNNANISAQTIELQAGDTTTAVVGGAINGTGALTGNNITISAGSIGTPGANPIPINVNAATSLVLRTSAVSPSGYIYVLANVVPSAELEVYTDTADGQSIDLNFVVATGNIRLPNLNNFGMLLSSVVSPTSETSTLNDDITVRFEATAGDINTGNGFGFARHSDTGGQTLIDNRGPTSLELMAGDDIDITGGLSAQTITLTAGMNISASSRISTITEFGFSGSLAIDGVAGKDITVTAGNIGSVVSPNFRIRSLGLAMFGPSSTLHLESTANSEDASIYAHIVRLPTVTDGDTPAVLSSLTVVTNSGSAQTVVLDLIDGGSFNSNSGFSLPATANFTGLANDTVTFNIIANNSGADLSTSALDLQVNNAFDLSMAGTSTIMIGAASLTGTGSISAGTVQIRTLSIGTSSAPFQINATENLILDGFADFSGSNGGLIRRSLQNVYVRGAVVPSDTLSHNIISSGARVDVRFSVSEGGDVQLPSNFRVGVSNFDIDDPTLPTTLPTTPAITDVMSSFTFESTQSDADIIVGDLAVAQQSTVTLMSARDIIFQSGTGATESGVLIADTAVNAVAAGRITFQDSTLNLISSNSVSLTAAGIGAVGSSINVNAIDLLTLTTTGAADAGNIFVSSTAITTAATLLTSLTSSASTSLSTSLSNALVLIYPRTINANRAMFMAVAPAAVAASLTTSLTTLLAPSLPTTTLTVQTARDSAQTVEFDFNLVAATTLPTTTELALVGDTDTITLDIRTTTGDLTVDSVIELRSASTTATVNLATNDGVIIAGAGSGSINADTIDLNAVGIGAVANRLTTNALQSLTLTTTGADGAGDIYIVATQLPDATLMASTDPSSQQTIDLDFNLAAADTLPTTFSIAGDVTATGPNAGTTTDTDNITLDISTSVGDLTVASIIDLPPAVNTATPRPIRTVNLMAAGAIIAAGTASSINADTISLNAVGSGIGTDATNRLTANALLSLTLSTTGADGAGNIYIVATQLPDATLMATTDPSSPQRIDLDFDLIAADTLPTTVAFTADTDTIDLDISTSAGSLTVASNLDLLPVSTTSTVRLTANAADGALIIGAATGADTDAADMISADTVELIAAQGISGAGVINADGSLEANSSGGSITGVSFNGNDVSLTATGIGTDATSRLTVNALQSLTLTTTGADSAGDIYIVATQLPDATLMASTDTSSQQTIDLDFNLAAADTLPTTFSIAGDVTATGPNAGTTT
ncbi:MAG: hypothetical protein K0U66_00720, partial [Gammaproteobacteria bacterium]|nr:hypothetical protein [Gammaproteobacteria bacterium]